MPECAACAAGTCEWIYQDGCKIYGINSPHGFNGPWLPDHEHDLITATQCWHCGDVVEFDPPAKTIREADERTTKLCSCGEDSDDGEWDYEDNRTMLMREEP